MTASKGKKTKSPRARCMYRSSSGSFYEFVSLSFIPGIRDGGSILIFTFRPLSAHTRIRANANVWAIKAIIVIAAEASEARDH